MLFILVDAAVLMIWLFLLLQAVCLVVFDYKKLFVHVWM